MTKLFRAEYGKLKPTEVEAEHPSYPHHDADGVAIYKNTHFEDLGMAWRQLLSEADAAEQLSARSVLEQRSALEHAEKDLVTAATYRFQLQESFRRGA